MLLFHGVEEPPASFASSELFIHELLGHPATTPENLAAIGGIIVLLYLEAKWVF